MISANILLQNITRIKKHIKNRPVTLIAVTKKHSPKMILALRALGISHFSENYIAELEEKALMRENKDIWYFQGKIQTNKIPKIVRFADVILSFTEYRHLETLQREAERHAKRMGLCIQVKLGNEENRIGIPANISNVRDLISKIADYPNLNFQGIMMVLSKGLNEVQKKHSFSTVASLWHQLPNAPILSIGMSSDYQLAIEYGATHIRIGTALLGTR